MILKKCAGYKTPEGEENPNCLKEFLVRACHFKRKELCDSCQKLKNNKYHKHYNKEWRERQKKDDNKS